MTDPATARLVERNMTAHRLAIQATKARLAQRRASADGDGPRPGQWACRQCGDGYLGTPPEHGKCDGCAAAEAGGQQ